MKKLQLISIIAMTLVAAAANAQWTVTVLHPGLAAESYATGASGANQVGRASNGAYDRAGLWSGTAGSWVGLHPAGATYSAAHGISGSSQVGEVDNHASLWHSSSASWVDLHPTTVYADFSTAFGASGSSQVGEAYIYSAHHASLWTGTSASWVDLHPAGANHSTATATSGTIQVGYAQFGNDLRASLWHGTAASWVDLSPAWATDSVVHGVSGSTQVGYAYVADIGRASLWHGSAASWVDLNPVGAAGSAAFGVSGANQVGYAYMDSYRACLWSGTAASWVDLHGLLAANFSDSIARSMTSDGVKDYVTGEGYNMTAGRWEALLWTRPSNFQLASFSIAPSGVVSGNQATGTVTINAPAPSGGLVVSLVDNSAALITPQSVTVPEGETSASFQIGTTVTSVQIMRQVKATLNSSTMTRNLIVILPDITTLNANPKVVIGGTNSTGTVAANGTTGNGFVVTLTSSGPEVIVPASVTFNYGFRTKTFPISTLPVLSTTVRVITANRNGRTRTVTMTVTRQ